MKFVTKIFSLSGLALAVSSVTALAGTYTADPSHSKVGFTVRHLMTKVSGEFRDFEAEFNFDPAKNAFGEGKFVVKAASINTGNDRRDDHLRSPDFFDVKKYPTLSVSAGQVKPAGKDKYKWTTDLTLHGVTKPVVFDVDFLGQGKDAQGNNRVGFEAKSRINRKDFGLAWNKVLEAGGTVVGDEVDIALVIQAVEQNRSAKK